MGRKKLFLNVQDWENLTIKDASNALFLKTDALIHITKYAQAKEKWIEIKINADQCKIMNLYLHNSFLLNEENKKIYISDKGYYSNDDFYKATGSYTLYYTCNTWVNNAFKECGLKSCVWTVFDFPLLKKYNPEYNFLNKE
jgi:hypothetical protein